MPIALDEIVSKIVSDPSNPPEVILLSGYLGSSSESGHIRLYFDPKFSKYIEIPETAIKHSQPIPVERSPLGGSYVWILRDADIIHGNVGTTRTTAKFLEGPIVEEYLKEVKFPEVLNNEFNMDRPSRTVCP